MSTTSDVSESGIIACIVAMC